MRSEAFEHYIADRSRRGSPAEGAFSGAAGGAACGDLARVSVRIEGGRVVSLSHDAEGCGAMQASAAAAAELADGSELLAAAAIGPAAIDAALGGLTPAKMHAPRLVADALHRALCAAAGSGEPLAPPAPGRALVAMSGGVDSAVAALLERRAGAEVVAVTLKLWADPRTDGERACCSPQAVLGARELAHSMGIPHLTLDLEPRFRREVVDSFVAGHAAGETPNPCVLCNGEVRIEAMVGLAERLGAQRLVTGHYATVVADGEGPLLAPAADPRKDQSYMLAALPPELLGRLSFPLSGMSKDEVRAVASREGLAVARKPESQDLCFLAGLGKREFLRTQGGISDRQGDLLDRRGRRLGRHRGHHHFTVGQRRGIGVASTEPLFVLATDADANSVTVGPRAALSRSAVGLRDAVLHRDGSRVDSVRLRYRAGAVGARVLGDRGPGRHETLRIGLREPFDGPAPGQVAVLMGGGAVVGHATIASET
ncbi:MAG: tRNA 2-thiouridine(34) synthase MnmA [Solirubrobacterales bacterium]